MITSAATMSQTVRVSLPPGEPSLAVGVVVDGGSTVVGATVVFGSSRLSVVDTVGADVVVLPSWLGAAEAVPTARHSSAATTPATSAPARRRDGRGRGGSGRGTI